MSLPVLDPDLRAELLHTAHHEAGHALIYLLDVQPFEHVSLTVVDERVHGLVAVGPTNCTAPEWIARSFAGPLAGELFDQGGDRGRVGFLDLGSLDDLPDDPGDDADHHSVVRMQHEAGMSDREVREIEAETLDLVVEHWDGVTTLAEYLYRRRALSYLEVLYFFRRDRSDSVANRGL